MNERQLDPRRRRSRGPRNLDPSGADLPHLAQDLPSDAVVEQHLLTETTARSALDLSDLDPKEQAQLIRDRTVDVLPSVDELRETIEAARSEGRPLTVKFGIDRPPRAPPWSRSGACGCLFRVGPVHQAYFMPDARLVADPHPVLDHTPVTEPAALVYHHLVEDHAALADDDRRSLARAPVEIDTRAPQAGLLQAAQHAGTSDHHIGCSVNRSLRCGPHLIPRAAG